MDAEDASTIGAGARKIRRRRGLSLDVVAGLAGIGNQRERLHFTLTSPVCWRKKAVRATRNRFGIGSQRSHSVDN